MPQNQKISLNAELNKPNDENGYHSITIVDSTDFDSVDVTDQWHRYLLGISHMFAMGVCGIVLVSLGMTLPGLALDCHSTSTALGSVFIARGSGAIMGPVASAFVYSKFPGWVVITLTLTFLGGALMCMPYIEDVWALHFLFMMLGFCTAITDTGVQILTRKAHGRDAGPWLGANTVFFGISGACVPVLVYFFPSLKWQYNIVACLSFGAALSVAVSPHMGSFTPPPPMVRLDAKQEIDSWLEDIGVEILCAFMVFCMIGGQVSITAYLIPFTSLSYPSLKKMASLLVVNLWATITMGRLGGLLAQCHMTTDTLYVHFYWTLALGSMSIIGIWYLMDEPALWIGVAIYGLTNGPTLGFLYDLLNRLTVQSEIGMSIVMFGLNFGASLMPYITTFTWEYIGLKQQALLVVLFFSMFLPFALLPLTKCLAVDHEAISFAPGKSLSKALVRQSSAYHLHDHYDEDNPGSHT